MKRKRSLLNLKRNSQRKRLRKVIRHQKSLKTMPSNPWFAFLISRRSLRTHLFYQKTAIFSTRKLLAQAPLDKPAANGSSNNWSPRPVMKKLSSKGWIGSYRLRFQAKKIRCKISCLLLIHRRTFAWSSLRWVPPTLPIKASSRLRTIRINW